MPNQSATTPHQSDTVPHRSATGTTPHQSAPVLHGPHQSASKPHQSVTGTALHQAATTQHKANNHGSHPEPSHPTAGPLVNPALERDINKLQQTTLPAPNASTLPEPHTEPTITLPAPLHGHAHKTLSEGNVLLVIPTENQFKVDTLWSRLADPKRKPANINLIHKLIVKADSGVGEQPYDSAGPQGAFNRVANAVKKLQNDEAHLKWMVDEGVGTVIVGAVENFIQRRHKLEDGEVVPADFGVVVFCRVPVSSLGEHHGHGGAGHHGEHHKGGHHDDGWKGKWVVGISGGVTVPMEYLMEARTHGFEDKEETHGKVTVGEVIEANIPEIKKADWHKDLARKSRYILLKEAVNEMEVPWS